MKTIIFNQIEELNEIQIEDTIYQLDIMLSGDLKFISIIMGVKSANSKHPCIWCKVEKKEFAKNFTGIALQFCPSIKFEPIGPF
jgi:hypothetical protein